MYEFGKSIVVHSILHNAYVSYSFNLGKVKLDFLFSDLNRSVMKLTVAL